MKIFLLNDESTRNDETKMYNLILKWYCWIIYYNNLRQITEI